MRLYSNKITEADVRGAFVTARIQNQADIYIDALRTFRPRRHTYGVEFWAESMNGSRASAHGPISSGPRDGMPRAASWTDYGYVIAHLFNIDPEARIGGYNSKADFVAKVHRWVPRGESLAFLDVLDGVCPACGSDEPDCKPGCTAVPAREHMPTIGEEAKS